MTETQNNPENFINHPLMPVFIEVANNEIYLQILLSLKLLEFLNLTQISEYIEKSKSNSLNYINKLIEMDLIKEVPHSQVNIQISRRGPKKFYTITEDAKTIIENFFTPFLGQPHQYITEYEPMSEMDMKKSLYNRLHQQKGMIDFIKLKGPLVKSVNNVIEKLIHKRYHDILDEIKSDNENVDIPVIEYNQFLESIPISSKDDALAITKLIHKFYVDLMTFKESQVRKIGKSDEKSGYQHIYLFLGPIDKNLFK